MHRSVPWRVIIGSNMQGSVPYRARFCSLSCRHRFTHVMIRSRACYHPFLNMAALDPTSHGTNVSMSSSVPLHEVIGSSMTGSVPWHGEWSSHKFWKVHIGWREEHDQATNIDTIFRIPVSIFRIHVSIFRSIFPIRSPDDVIFCLGEFWDSDQGYADCVVKVGCDTSWRIWKWLSPLRQIFGDSVDLKDQSDNFSHLQRV